ncbi:YqiA/YcfP family alpha/beta fold hydrolase [Salinisphaera sp. SPP-AMP-43]|uniref:YqiA/YcfP family alpha/beta fold hydrolase n=1 Tax=Salinisphaera sp. SPP-AMP-43 TaxID=3121288 RepID=UPI003C6E6101
MSDATPQPRVVFAHGKESGPWGSKITHLARIAETLGFVVESLDYQDMDDPQERVAHLIDHAPSGAPLVLVGSSMGGYVSAMSCAALAPEALLLLAPALYLEGYPGEPLACPADTVVVHGWDDDIVPLASSLDFARPRRAALHVLADGHRLANSIGFIERVFTAQLQRVLTTSSD